MTERALRMALGVLAVILVVSAFQATEAQAFYFAEDCCGTYAGTECNFIMYPKQYCDLNVECDPVDCCIGGCLYEP